MPFVTVNNVTYEYNEQSFSKNRGIAIGVKGSNDMTRYQLRPNPHDNKKYIKNPPLFYLDLATDIAGTAQQNNGNMPPDGTKYTVLDVEYELTVR
jgi:hypothetical protein